MSECFCNVVVTEDEEEFNRAVHMSRSRETQIGKVAWSHQSGCDRNHTGSRSERRDGQGGLLP